MGHFHQTTAGLCSANSAIAQGFQEKPVYVKKKKKEEEKDETNNLV